MIKSDVKEELRKNMSATYPTTENLKDSEECLQYLPASLRDFLSTLFVGKDKNLKNAGIGQAIMQAVAPRTAVTPLQIGLAIQVHRQYGSKNLVQELHSLGFCTSYSDVSKYIRSAAFHQGTDMHLTEGSFVQYIADNVDHNLRTLDGENTFHGMGIIAAITPSVKISTEIPRIKISSTNLLSKSHIEIRYFKSKVIPKLAKFTDIMHEAVASDRTYRIDLLWCSAWLLKPDRPLWGGYMQFMSQGSHPGKSCVKFLPMIDMPASNESCILSTLNFIADHARKHKVHPIITFDEPLYWKALLILQTEEYLKHIVLRLGGFHTTMSYLGTIGYFMKSSGLQELLDCLCSKHCSVCTKW